MDTNAAKEALKSQRTITYMRKEKSKEATGQRIAQIASDLNQLLGNSNLNSSNLEAKLEDGAILCEAFNKIFTAQLKINSGADLSQLKKFQNINSFIQGCVDKKISQTFLFEVSDLLEHKNFEKVVSCLDHLLESKWKERPKALHKKLSLLELAQQEEASSNEGTPMTSNDTYYITDSNGTPVESLLASQTVGPNGPMLLHDFVFLDHHSAFNRERIPERVVHAKGAGASGYFEVTHDITKYTKAKLFSEIGKQTAVLWRGSTVGGESGSADTARDPRGFAVKFYTEEGNWDIVGNNTPIFFLRDPLLFPGFVHSQKRNPETGLKDPNMFWDFISLRPETLHQVSFLFSERGVPDGYRHMNGYGSHTFKMVNANGEAFYCKFHFKTNQGIKNLDSAKATELAGSDPDYAIRDLFNSIRDGNYPSWTMYIQVMTFEQAQKVSFNPFDLTKIWPHKDFPLLPVGKLVLNRNPQNYFAEIEQAAFAPGHMVPGIEPSPDRMLQGRLWSYADAQRYRLGVNYKSIPVNCPFSKVHNYQRDGFARVDGNQEGKPNYFPNSFGGPHTSEQFALHHYQVSGDVYRYDTGDEDNFSQVADFYNKTLNEKSRDSLTSNIANHLRNALPEIQKRVLENFAKVDADYAKRIQQKLSS